jgi:uncharacterized protein YjbI with pentapeptide repeats
MTDQGEQLNLTNADNSFNYNSEAKNQNNEQEQLEPSEPNGPEIKQYIKEKIASLTIPPKQLTYIKKEKSSYSGKIVAFLVIAILGVWFNIPLVGFIGAILAILFSSIQIIPITVEGLRHFLTPQARRILIGLLGFLGAIAIILKYLGIYQNIGLWLTQFKYDEFGSWADWVGALGQILIAILAVYVAWQQYVISKDLTTQQNLITQQQTIDAYFQGISDLVLGPDGLLEDWPQERAIAEGRTAAILSSVDSSGKAKILRFLSRSRLLTPLRRDSHLGRPILDGSGGYSEDRAYGTRVINIGVVLAATNLRGQDLRWTDLSEANMVRANLSRCDLVKANLSRTVLYEVNLEGADLKGVRLFYGSYFTASPRSRTQIPNYETGEYTGVVIEKANLRGVKNLSEENRYYCCAWGGDFTRSTIPGGCQSIPDLLKQQKQR